MSIHPGQLREYIIRPTLRQMGLYSEAAEELLMLTPQWPTAEPIRVCAS